jgi:hypothetical protein
VTSVDWSSGSATRIDTNTRVEQNCNFVEFVEERSVQTVYISINSLGRNPRGQHEKRQEENNNLHHTSGHKF